MERDDLGRTADHLADYVREHGPTPYERLARQAKLASRKLTVAAERLRHVVDTDPRLIVRTDGIVTHLCHVLDGTVFTQRVGSSTRGRTELWTTLALLPISMLAAYMRLPLVQGGQIECGPHPRQHTLVGPRGWLPTLEPGELLGCWLAGGTLSVRRIAEDTLPDPPRGEYASTAVHRHYRGERCWYDETDLFWQPDALLDAIVQARLENPELFTTPLPPLDELLHVDQTMSCLVTGIPMALHGKLVERARACGVTFDQYVIALLGRLAGRVPYEGRGGDEIPPAVLQLVPSAPGRERS